MEKLFSSVESGETCAGLELILGRFSTGTVLFHSVSNEQLQVLRF